MGGVPWIADCDAAGVARAQRIQTGKRQDRLARLSKIQHWRAAIRDGTAQQYGTVVCSPWSETTVASLETEKAEEKGLNGVGDVTEVVSESMALLVITESGSVVMAQEIDGGRKDRSGKQTRRPVALSGRL